MSEVAAFVFTSLPDSYAARTDRPGNVGVIGVAAFREYRPPRRPLDLQQPEQLSGPRGQANESDAARSPAPSAMLKREDKLGTGHGERESSYASWTDFRRVSESPEEIVSIWYDSRANLVARGIIPLRSAEPSPFPGFRFVPDPRS
jgi:hypothetical protein